MTVTGIFLDVRNHRGAHMGNEYCFDTRASGIARTCDRIRLAGSAYRMIGVPEFGIVTIDHDAHERPFSWIERFTADPDGPAGPAFVVGNAFALACAIRAHRDAS